MNYGQKPPKKKSQCGNVETLYVAAGQQRPQQLQENAGALQGLDIWTVQQYTCSCHFSLKEIGYNFPLKH